jgi:transposase
MYKINAEMTKEIREEMKITKKAGIYKKLHAVALRGEGFKNDEIARITGYNSNYVGELCKLYITSGMNSFKADGRKGGNNQVMDMNKAMEFIKQFEEKAIKGEIITVDEISSAYNTATAKERESNSSIYYLLHRVGWRQIVPKKQHPGKASAEEIEASKKLTLSLRK